MKNKKANTILFILASTVINVIVLLLLIILLIALATVLIGKVFHMGDNGNVVVVSYTLCFVLAMIGNMILSAKVTSWVINRFHLEDKLETNFIKTKKKTASKNTQNYNAEPEEEKKKTRLPDSVLMTDDDE